MPGGRSCLAAAGRASDGLEIQSGEEPLPSPKDREQPDWEESPGGNASGWLHVVPGQGSSSRDCSLLWMAWSAVLQSAALHPSAFWGCLSGELIHISVLSSNLLMARAHIPLHIHREAWHRDMLGGTCSVSPAKMGIPGVHPPANLKHFCLTGDEGLPAGLAQGTGKWAFFLALLLE